MRTPLALLLLVFLVAADSAAQEVRGNLEARVVDSRGQPVIAVDVLVTGPSLLGERGATTNESGYFRLLALPVGSYSVRLERLGYHMLILEDVVVRLGRTTTLGDIQLTVAPVDVEEVVARGERTLIDPASTAGGFNLTRDLYATLPIERDYQQMIALIPQANASYYGDGISVAGATGGENKYFVEGVDVTDPLLGYDGASLPYNFVREVEVKTGGYEAEYRSSLGGVVNAITYAGGNDFHGEIFGFYANDRFESTPRPGPLDLTSGGYSHFDVGFTLGGPVARDRLWFFGAYNPTFVREEVDVPDHGMFEDKRTTHAFAGKLSWRPAPNTNVYFTAFGDPGSHEAVQSPFPEFTFVNPDSWLSEVTTGGVGMILNATQLINERTLLEASVYRVTRKNKTQPRTERGQEAYYLDFVNGTAEGGIAGKDDASVARTGLDLTATLSLGSHTLKAGFSYLESKHEANGSTWDVVARVGPDTYFHIEELTLGTVRNRIPSVFAQDSWQVTQRLRLNAGLRWDGQFWIGSDGKVAQRITDQFQPRLGFVLLPGRLGTQKIFGSFGRFYQENTLNLLGFFNEEGFFRGFIFDHDPRVDPSGGVLFQSSGGTTHPEIADLKGQHYDEFTLGYERQLGGALKVGIRGVYRALRWGIEDGYPDPEETEEITFGNPGRGAFSDFPRLEREYTALEFTAEQTLGDNLDFVSTYVLSRTYGNYEGLFSALHHQATPNFTMDIEYPDLFHNATGLLPQNRTHMFKLCASYRMPFGLSFGGSVLWGSGTPLSELGGSRHSPYPAYLTKRGSAGKTPSIWDVNFRFVYDLSRVTEIGWETRLIADLFHVGNPREVVDIEQVRYLGLDDDGNQATPNPTYGQPLRYQPPMTLRFGLEVRF